MNIVNKALLIAISAHKDQFDKSGIPYINHPVFVALNMESDEEKAAALLHDTLEDSDYTAEMLLSEGIPQNVVNAVILLTRHKDEDYFDYVKKVEKNPISKKVKIADLKHNMDLSRLPQTTEKDLKRLEKYKKALEYLTK